MLCKNDFVNSMLLIADYGMILDVSGLSFDTTRTAYYLLIAFFKWAPAKLKKINWIKSIVR